MIVPVEFHAFIYHDDFMEDWIDFGLGLDIDLWNLEIELSGNPTIGDVIQGSGGLRKMRWNLPGRGKRGGLRVIYLWIPGIKVFYMFMVYSKSTSDDLTEETLKRLRTAASKIRTRLLEDYKK